MFEASIFEAKTRLSELVKRAQRGEKIILTTGGKRTPVAMIVPLKPANPFYGMTFQSGTKFMSPSLSPGVVAGRLK